MKLTTQQLKQTIQALSKHVSDQGKGIGCFGHDSSLNQVLLESRIEDLNNTLSALKEACKEMTELVVRRWSDQPSILEEGTHLCNCKAAGNMVQVIANEDTGLHYVTVGSLFGSQTVECKTAHDAFRCIDILSNNEAGVDPKDHDFTLLENDGDNEG